MDFKDASAARVAAIMSVLMSIGMVVTWLGGGIASREDVASIRQTLAVHEAERARDREDVVGLKVELRHAVDDIKNIINSKIIETTAPKRP